MLLGATATGKSALALALAQECEGVEIVSIDSMQVYRGMDIGTAKPSATERAEVPHHLLDLADPWETYSVAAFQAAARGALAAIEGRGHHALLVGGTGLYVRAVVDDLDLPGLWPEVRHEIEEEPDTAALHRRLSTVDPVSAARMEPGNRRRVVRALEVSLGSGRPFSSFGPGMESYPESRFRHVGLTIDRTLLDERIKRRFDAMLTAGLLDEVRALAAHPGGLSSTAREALGYRELLAHLEGHQPLESAADEAVRRTRSFARRQERWFRRDPRVTWLGHDGNSLALLPRVLGDWVSCN